MVVKKERSCKSKSKETKIWIVNFQILKGETTIPTWLSTGAQNLLKRILDPNPKTRIDMQGIKSDNWFMQHYIPAVPYDEEEDKAHDSGFPIKEVG